MGNCGVIRRTIGNPSVNFFSCHTLLHPPLLIYSPSFSSPWFLVHGVSHDDDHAQQTNGDGGPKPNSLRL
jgi:hypothetical protein